MTDHKDVPTLDPTDGMELSQSPSGMWFVRHRDYPGCLTSGHTREDAVAEFWRDAAILMRLRLDAMMNAARIDVDKAVRRLAPGGRSQDYRAGHRHAIRTCIAWLHERAGQMVEPKAKAILDSAATTLGHQSRRARDLMADEHTRRGQVDLRQPLPAPPDFPDATGQQEG